MLAWSYESNMPSCGHGYCALCRPCSASSASATPATPSSAKLLNPIAANPWLGAQCAPVGSALAAAGRAAAAAAARAARQLVSEAEHRPCVAHVDSATART